MKKIISILMALAISVMSFSVMTVNADSELQEPELQEPELQELIDNTIGLYYLYTNTISSVMSISGGSATCASTVTGRSGVTKIIITQTLQKNSSDGWYNYLPSKSKTFNSSSAIYTNTYSPIIIGQYRTKTVAKVYKGNNYETVGPAYSVTQRYP